ncbi:hypothetical protein MKW92_039761 [Papaver armeniacum]|nr:hypothetical protein MKW92_039761 [Papaver armeniacum]
MRSPMARNLGFLFVLISVVAICEASVFQPVSENHRSAALELFSPVDGSFTSLEEAYEALRTFQILGVEENTVSSTSTCPLVVKNLQSSSSPKDLFYALKVNSFLNCKVEANTFAALSHSDGRWRLNSKSAESSIYAAGLALEALAGVVSLSSAEIDQSLIGTVKNDVVKLFDSLEKYDDGASYFNEKLTDAREDQGPISTSSSVVRGLAAFASVGTGKINLSGDKILGLAKYFLGIGVPGSAKDLFNQIDSLVSVPLILSLPATVVSLSDKNQLKVKVTTVLGSGAPPLTVKLVQAFQPSSKDTPLIENKELKFDSESNAHSLDVLPLGFDIGKYVFVFRVLLHDSEHKKIYATGGQTQVPIFLRDQSKLTMQRLLSWIVIFRVLETRKREFVPPDLGHVELDLPKAPEKATRAPLQPADPYLRYGPKPEITHIFRLPEKRPRQELSLLSWFLPFFYVWGVNLKKFPTSESSPLVHAVLFHVFLAAILGWYLLFWLKMDLFTTLKQLGILGAMLLYFGHRTLSYLASGSSKQKSA